MERPPSEWDEFLQARCDDPEVRQEVASLLQASEEAPDFFDQFADAVIAPALNEFSETEKRESRAADPLNLEGAGIGRYVVKGHLAGGGMGVVYKARDTQLNRAVALKFLPPYLTTHPEAEERFVREAQSAASLDHPHIATIHEIDETEDGRRFIAMAYYDGETLKEKLNEGPLPVEEALGYAIQIADGLTRAHETGIVHRDVKPDNVIVTEHGTAKLLDFGLAQAATETRLTAPGRRMGTAAYMSPEQAEGEAIDHRADLWSLGVVLYELLTAERPFTGERYTAVLHSILYEEPVPIREYRSEVPSILAQIVARCLQKDPNQRYASARELHDNLRAVRRGETRIHAEGPVLEGMGASDRPIAVLPFGTIGTTEVPPFTDGIHGDLLTRLSRLSGLQVISRTSVLPYRDTDTPIRQIARELGVRWVLEGEVQEAGDQVQVNTRLVDAQADQQVWARDYRRDLTAESLFDIQGDITEKIARSLKAELTPEEKRQVEQRPTDNLAAYRLYAQGRGNLDQRTEEGIRQALDYFQRAIEQDPDYALAWAGLTDALSLFAFYGFTPPDDAPDPMGAARRAVDLDPKLGEARTSLGIHHAIRHEGPAALQELSRAVGLAPSYAEAHIWLGWPQLCLVLCQSSIFG